MNNLREGMAQIFGLVDFYTLRLVIDNGIDLIYY